MIEALAVVVKVQDHHIWVAAAQNSACGGCLQKAACTSHVLGKTLRQRAVPVDSIIKLHVGEQVTVGIDEQVLLRASLLLYLLPILALFTGAGLSDWLLAGIPDADVITAASGFLSCLLCLWLIHIAQNRMMFTYYARPVVINKV